MLQNEIEDVFNCYGNGHLYEKLKYPLYLSGAIDKIEIEMLENFLELYNFDSEKTLLFDEFMYHFRIYEAVLNLNDLPIKYL